MPRSILLSALYLWAVWFAAFADNSCRTQAYMWSVEENAFVCAGPVETYCPNGADAPCIARDEPFVQELPPCATWRPFEERPAIERTITPVD